MHAQRFPGETAAYRKARDRLLKAEIDLRRRVEAVAVARRKLRTGGAVPQDYVFEGVDELMGVRRVRLSELFAPGKDTLVLYNFMYGPAMERPCPMCTSMLDALDGNAQHITQRVNLAVVAKSPLPRILAFAQERGWRRVRLLSSAGNSYNRDYFGEGADGKQWPALNVFRKRGAAIHHFWGTELMFVPGEKGQDPRHVDFMWPLWNLFDVTPEGRGDWYPRLDY
ncbi:MAG: DUF899 family protein [Gammaproteobacteria bacterium]|nr:DUF899 family protein [Gammaproteobacteria bacterium]